jgi:hypothetical protein
VGTLPVEFLLWQFHLASMVGGLLGLLIVFSLLPLVGRACHVGSDLDALSVFDTERVEGRGLRNVWVDGKKEAESCGVGRPSVNIRVIAPLGIWLGLQRQGSATWELSV